MRLASTVAFIFVFASGPAQADWLDTVWSEQFTAESGDPSITLGPGTVHITLPANALKQAYREGYTIRSASIDFLRRYGQCSSLLDLGKSHSRLRISVSVQSEQDVEDEILKHQEEIIVLRSQEREEAAPRSRLKRAFGVSAPVAVLVEDYTPGDRKVRCVIPGAPGS